MGRHVRKKNLQEKQSTKDKLKSIKKERKLKLKQKRARLIIRNLPFQATEENLREHFGKYGELEDVQILKKEDGHLVGCAFVQYKLVQKAAKARHHLNGKPFLERDLEVDFALPKEKYTKENDKVEVKQEIDEVKIKEEPQDVDETIEETKIENDEQEEVVENEEQEEVEELERSDAESDKEDSDEDNERLDEEVEEEEEIQENKPKFESNDITEGKTIFVKNVPFDATNDDLKQCMKQFGPVYYALICVDKFTEHSKGTAFIKFVNVEDAEKALAAGTELKLFDNILDCHKALGRNEVKGKAMAKKEEKTGKKDARNLYLVKEGVILAGTKAAEGVSASDMAKRLQLEQYKTQMLRNLNMFVSRERLVVHNLPPSWDDNKFRALIKNNSPKNSVIKEARIMRDLKNVDANGIGKSKEFGFVSFMRHEDAIATLRSLNNNPNIFSAQRRPIVAFSIENKAMIKAKEKRLEKSRLKNPKCKEFNPEVVKKEQKIQKKVVEENGNRKEFVGVAAKPGVQKMRSRYNLKIQAKLHHENLKKEKKKNKFAKKTLQEKQRDFIKQPKQKINNKRKNNDNFAKLVSDYKKKLLAVPEVKKTKWYE